MPRPKKPIYLSIKNFEEYQHYKTRNPPWIKLYYSLLDDDDFNRLSEVDQCRLIKLFLIASKQRDNRILFDENYLAKMLRIAEKPDLTALLDSGWLLASRYQKSSKMLRQIRESEFSPLQNNSETETETERESENTSGDLHLSPPLNGHKPAKSTATWESYRATYVTRYGVDPVRNQQVNSMLCKLVDKLGAEAPAVAGFYVTHNNEWYVGHRHPVSCLVKDAEGLRTQWATGVVATKREAASASAKDEVSEQFKRLNHKLEVRDGKT